MFNELDARDTHYKRQLNGGQAVIEELASCRDIVLRPLQHILTLGRDSGISCFFTAVRPRALAARMLCTSGEKEGPMDRDRDYDGDRQMDEGR